MKLYFAASHSTKDITTILKYTNRLLFTYFDFQNTDSNPYKYGNDLDIFMDSGAFSVWKSGASINIDSYIEFLKRYQIKTAASLDVVGDAQGTLNNWDYMTSKGVITIPTYHVGEPFSFLDYYLKNADYIALGGMVGKSQVILEDFLNKCFSLIKSYFPVKIHGFGCFNFKLLMAYPFYSVDATTWNVGRKYGECNIMDSNFNLVRRSSSRKIVHHSDFKIDRDFVKFTTDGNYRTEVSIKAYCETEKLVTEIWSKRGIVWA